MPYCTKFYSYNQYQMIKHNKKCNLLESQNIIIIKWQDLLIQFDRFISNQMGSSHVKDENIQIFMQLSQQFYFSGGVVQGQIYIRVKQPSTYSKLVIGVQGLQYVFWSEGSGKNRRNYKNTYESYNSYFVVMDFANLIQQGDYIFPFSFLLPNMITGSYFHSKNCFIKYTIKAQLIHPNEAKRNQFYSMFLNILQPPRMAIGPSTVTNTVNSRCCGCCANYGFTSVTMNCDRNFVMNGDMIKIDGIINNSRGTQIIQQSKIVLERRRCMISKSGKVYNSIQQTYQYQTFGSIQPKDSFNFNFVAKIPDQIMSCTAIGNIASNYWVIHLYTNYGCCANKADAQLNIIFHSRTPIIIKPDLIPQPANWYPKVFPKAIYQNMNAYIYNPRKQIPFLNSQGNQIISDYSYQTNNFYNQNSNNFEEMNQNQMKGNGENWGQNHSYKPVFYDQKVVNDAQRQYSNDKGNKSAQNTQNQIYRRL